LETRVHGISVFSIHPGTVRTPMNDYTRTSEIVRRRAPHLQERFVKLYAEGTDTPIEKSVDLILFLASGEADALSGRYISVEDDVHEMVRRADEIKRADLYTLQLHKLGEA
jgi:NAD(P)-dependent dehydrogenase (short-subunit alcohol dehydrogenase family)